MRRAVRVCIQGYGHYWLWVVTYPTRQALKAAAEKYFGGPIPDMSVEEEDGILGCFFDNQLKTNYLGIMRLWDTGYTTVLHECVHAAVAVANKNHGKHHMSTVKEEAIAYSTTAIADAVVKALYEGES